MEEEAAVGRRYKDSASLEAEIRRLQEVFVFRDARKVTSFIRKHVILAGILEESHLEIQRYFGPNPGVSLQVNSDPELQGAVEMFGYIATALTPEEAGHRLEQFDRNWFLQQVPRIKGLLNFDLEFVCLSPGRST